MSKALKALFLIDGGTYQCPVIVSVGHTPKQIQAFGQKNKLFIADSILCDLALSDRSSGRMLSHEGGFYVILLRDFRLDGSSIGTVAHEVFHVIENTFGCIGLPLADASSEAWTYHLDYLMTQIMDGLLRKVRRA